MALAGSSKRGWLFSIAKNNMVVSKVFTSTLKEAMDKIGDYKRIHHKESVKVVFWDKVDGSIMPVECDADLVMIALKAAC